MFENVGWPELLVIAMVGLFVLGPERLPAAAAWVANTVRTIRDYAVGARDQLRSELGPEYEELRKPLEDLRSVRDLDPRRAVRQTLFSDPPADGTWSGAPTPAASPPATPAAPAAPPATNGRAPEKPLGPGEIAPLDPDAT